VAVVISLNRFMPLWMTPLPRNNAALSTKHDGRGPVTRNRVPDREEQGKPRNDARRGRCHPVVIPLNNPLGPADDTVTAPLCSTSTSTVPDREEPGKPRKDARRGRCHPLE